MDFAAHRVAEREQILGDALALGGEQRAKLFVVLVAVEQLGFEGFLALDDVPLVFCEEERLSLVGGEFLQFPTETLDGVRFDERGDFALTGLVALILGGDGVGTLAFEGLLESPAEFGAPTIKKRFQVVFDIGPPSEESGAVGFQCVADVTPAPDFGALVRQELTKLPTLNRQCERAAPVMERFAQIVDGEFLHCEQQHGVRARWHSAPTHDPALP